MARRPSLALEVVTLDLAEPILALMADESSAKAPLTSPFFASSRLAQFILGARLGRIAHAAARAQPYDDFRNSITYRSPSKADTRPSPNSGM